MLWSRMRQALRATVEQVDVLPDTLVFRAMQAPAEDRYDRAGV
ncbi:MAG: hypothetical protein ACKOT0_09750 [bacterium]